MTMNTVAALAAWNESVEQVLDGWERDAVAQSFEAMSDLVEHDVRVRGVVRGQRVA